MATTTEKLRILSQEIEETMANFNLQIEALMEEAEENEEEVNIVDRGMYINMVEVMQEIAPDCPCFYDVVNLTATAPYDERSSLDFFFNGVEEELVAQITDEV